MSTRGRMIARATLAVAIATLLGGGALGYEADYIGLFKGAWGGSGVVLNDSKPWGIDCTAVGVPGTDRLAIRASCHVLLWITVNINVDVAYDPQSNRYGGTYSAGDMTATISGKRSGDTVEFAMTWNKPIDSAGNTRGRLTIVNAGHGDFRLMIDNFKTNGPQERTTDVTLRRS
jgi:hypothetical protein